MCLEQNRMFVDRAEDAGRGPNLDFFADVVNEWLLTKLFFAIEYDFIFFASSLSALS